MSFIASATACTCVPTMTWTFFLSSTLTPGTPVRLIASTSTFEESTTPMRRRVMQFSISVTLDLPPSAAYSAEAMSTYLSPEAVVAVSVAAEEASSSVLSPRPGVFRLNFLIMKSNTK